MEKVKTIVDREPVSSDYIGAKRDFKHVLNQAKNLKSPIWKTAWFYGPVGVAVIAITISVTSIDTGSGLSKDKKIDAKELKANVNETTRHPQVAQNQRVITHPVNEVRGSAKKSNQLSIREPKQQEVSEVYIADEEIDPEPEIQNEIVSEPMRVRKNYLPHIGKNYTGAIGVESLCSEKGILCNDEIDVIGFNIQYFSGNTDKTTKVSGNTIPVEVCEMIRAHNIGNMVFITEIKGVNAQGEIINLSSLNFEPTL